jgi:uracil-DNA glycosylase family 4
MRCDLASAVPDADRGANRAESFAELVEAAGSCRVCPRMDERRRVLGPGNGSLIARVCFVAEAPGRLGGDRTGIPLSGDQSGRNFDRLLNEAGLERSEVFITNAVLCNPRDAAGRNAAPTVRETRACFGFLKATIDLLQPDYAVALGAVALRALSLIERHDLTVSVDVGTVVRWYGRWLIPLYHPGPRAQIHRNFEQQAEDFRRLGSLVSGEESNRSMVPDVGREPSLQPTPVEPGVRGFSRRAVPSSSSPRRQHTLSQRTGRGLG